MLFFPNPLQVIRVVLSESTRKQQEDVIEYLRRENQVLCDKIGGKCVLLSDNQRRLLAVKGKAFGRCRLSQVATIAQADTILRWHRELIASQGDSQPARKTGRPRTSREVVDLVVRMAHENPTWGYKRIEGALRNVGYGICSSTVRNILKQRGIDPAPSRQRNVSWSTFLAAHRDVLKGLDLATVVFWLTQLVHYVMNVPSWHPATVSSMAVENHDVMPHPTTLAFQIARLPETATQTTRGPRPFPQLPNARPKIRHAA